MPHEPTRACLADHCHSCGEDEPIPDGTKPYQVCLECGHVYPTARSLRRAYRRADRQMSGPWTWRGTPGWDDPAPRRLLRALRIRFLLRASQITFCQHCVHDF